MNRVTILGRLTRDVDHRNINDDTRVAKFTVVTEERVKNKKSGEWEGKSTFHEIDAWNSHAKFMENFKKGSVISIVGSIFNDNYEDKDGKKVYKNRIRVRELSFVPREYTGEKKAVTATTATTATTEKQAADAPL